jgi:2-keto-3-deoxy-L-rhamnonate aldolase RhmA
MSLKNKLKNRELTIGSWITIGSTVVAEIMAKSGFDWLTVDMEHSAITVDIAQDLIRVIELCGVVPLVRVGKNEPNLIKRVMDSGAHGIIVPMVNSREDAEQAVRSVKYPPQGFRGVGLARAQSYGANFESYRQWNQQESIVIVQVEHIDSVNHLESILAVEGVDGFIIGPYDLSGSLGVPGQFEHPDVINALNRVREVTQQMNALSGFHVIPPEINAFREKQQQGYKFIAHSIDILYLGNHCRNAVTEIKKCIETE